MSVCVSVCLSASISLKYTSDLCQIFVHVTYCLGSLLWRRCDTLCTSGLWMTSYQVSRLSVCCVCCVGYTSALCKNGWTDWSAIGRQTKPIEPCVRLYPDTPRERVLLQGRPLHWKREKHGYVLGTCSVVALFFSAGGIILSRSDDIESVQLTDFTNAITVSQLEDDAEIAELLRDSLSPETIPPEVRALFSFSHHYHHFICIKIKTCRIQTLPFKQH